MNPYKNPNIHTSSSFPSFNPPFNPSFNPPFNPSFNPRVQPNPSGNGQNQIKNAYNNYEAFAQPPLNSNRSVQDMKKRLDSLLHKTENNGFLLRTSLSKPYPQQEMTNFLSPKIEQKDVSAQVNQIENRGLSFTQQQPSSLSRRYIRDHNNQIQDVLPSSNTTGQAEIKYQNQLLQSKDRIQTQTSYNFKNSQEILSSKIKRQNQSSYNLKNQNVMTNRSQTAQMSSQPLSRCPEVDSPPQFSLTNYVITKRKNEQLAIEIAGLKNQISAYKQEISTNKKQYSLNVSTYDKKIKSLIDRYEEQILTLTNCSKKQIETLTQSYSTQISEQKNQYETQIREQKNKYEDKIAGIVSSHQATINLVTKELIDTRKRSEEEYKRLKDEKNTHIKQLIQQLTTSREDIKLEIMSEYSSQILQESKRLHEQIGKEKEKVENLEQRIRVLMADQELKNSRQSLYTTSMNKMIEQIELAASIIISMKNGQQYYTDKNTRSFVSNSWQNELSVVRNDLSQLLKTQLDQTKLLKQKIEQLQGENKILRDKLIQMTREIQKIKNDQRIQEVKQKAEKNKTMTETGIENMRKQNEIASLKKKYTNLEERYKLAVKDNNFKDQFIKKNLTGLSHEKELKIKILQILQQYEGYFKNNGTVASARELKQINQKLQNKINYYERIW